MVTAFVPGVKKPTNISEDALWLAFQDGNLVVFEDDDGIMVPQGGDFDNLAIPYVQQHYLGEYEGQQCFAVDVPAGSSLPADYHTAHLYQLLDGEDDTLFQLAGRAKQIIEWDQNHQFCSRCGTPTEYHDTDRAKSCPKCHYHAYPRLAPSIIVLVTRGDEVLLARSPNFPPKMFSTLAGFVEVGETLEDCLRREVWEEVGIEIKNPRYHVSQPWPFPHSLMVGFFAEYARGEIRIDEKEIADARWWRIDALPSMPPGGAISRALIDSYVEQMRGSISPW